LSALPPRKKAVLYHPLFTDFGGAEMVAAWTLQVLQEDYDPILWCDKQPDFQRVDARYGTNLSAHPPAVIPGLSRRAKFIQSIWPGRAQLLQNATTMGDLQRLEKRCNPTIWVSTFNEVFLPKAGIQYIHWPGVLRVTQSPPEWSWIRRKIWEASQQLSWWVGSGSTLPRTPLHHRFLTNSQWTANSLRDATGQSSTVVHPPVPPFNPGLPWAERENRVVCLGRWNLLKRLTIAADIVKKARANGAKNLRLAFVGFWDAEADEQQQILAHCAGQEWIEWHENLERDKLQDLVGRSRYGLHAMLDEHFGIAIAEMMTAGCIVFSHNSGGPPGILDDNRQIYDDVAAGAQKMSDLVASPDLQSELHQKARPRGLQYSPAAFCDHIRSEIQAFVNATPPPERPHGVMS